MSAPSPLILLVEDEIQMRRFLRASVTSFGYRLLEAPTLLEGLQLASSHNPDVILLDLGLPDGDGVALCRQIREWTRTPIIVLSARGREDDKVEALDAGADDYLTKPFGVKELLARIRVSLRHAREAEAPNPTPVIEAGPLRIDLERREVTVASRAVHLTPIEYRLLALLGRHAGKVLTHRKLLREVWGPHQQHQTHYVRVHLAEIRRKIEADPARPRLILTEPGVGYRLRDTADD